MQSRGAVIGCDIQETHSVDVSYATFGTRYLRQVFHPSELSRAQSAGDRSRLVAFLAGRFAAKEALFKTLGALDTDAVRWRDFEIVSTPSGPQPVLHGTARRLAHRGGLTAFSVSISHVAGFAMATAIASPTGSPRIHTHTNQKAGSPVNDTTMDDRIRKVLAAHGHLDGDASTLSTSDDLYTAGMSSHASINVMLALEDEFDFEFPESALTKSTFASIERIRTEMKALNVD